jgi:hypothetical protein
MNARIALRMQYLDDSDSLTASWVGAPGEFI